MCVWFDWFDRVIPFAVVCRLHHAHREYTEGRSRRAYLIIFPAFLSSTVSHKPHQQAAAPRTMATPKYSAAMSPELSDGCPFESGGVPGAAALALWCVCGCGWVCDGIKIGWLILWIDRARRETLHWLLDHDAVGLTKTQTHPVLLVSSSLRSALRPGPSAMYTMTPMWSRKRIAAQTS